MEKTKSVGRKIIQVHQTCEKKEENSPKTRFTNDGKKDIDPKTRFANDRKKDIDPKTRCEQRENATNTKVENKQSNIMNRDIENKRGVIVRIYASILKKLILGIKTVKPKKNLPSFKKLPAYSRSQHQLVQFSVLLFYSIL